MKAWKKFLTLICVGTLAAVIGLLAACDGTDPKPDPTPDDPTPPTVTVTLDKNTMSLDEGATGTLNATVTGSDAAITADSSNKSVATVSVSGKVVTVSALTAGNSTVTVSVGDKSATCAVTVNAVIQETAFELSTNYVVLEDGYTENDDTADITVMNVDVTYTGDETVTCEIANEEVATAEYANGKVTLTAVGTGKTTLTVSAGDESKTCTVEVATFGLVYGNVLEDENPVMEVSDSDLRTSADVYIPGYYWFEDDEAYYPVTQIKGGTANGATFEDNGGFIGSDVVTVYTGDNVKIVGGKAFKDCKDLETVHFGAALRTIDGYAFNGCAALATIDWGESKINRIGRVAFDSCASLTEITIPSTCTAIGDAAFNLCNSLAKVRILSNEITILYGMTFIEQQNNIELELWLPASITEIAKDAIGSQWYGQNKKVTVYYNGTAEQYAAINYFDSSFDFTAKNLDPNESHCTVIYNADFDALLEAENTAD